MSLSFALLVIGIFGASAYTGFRLGYSTAMVDVCDDLDAELECDPKSAPFASRLANRIRSRK